MDKGSEADAASVVKWAVIDIDRDGQAAVGGDLDLQAWWFAIDLDNPLVLLYLLCRYIRRQRYDNCAIQKWGNSLALRIPKPLAAEVGLEDNSPVELSLCEGKLVISPVAKGM